MRAGVVSAGVVSAGVVSAGVVSAGVASAFSGAKPIEVKLSAERVDHSHGRQPGDRSGREFFEVFGSEP